MIKDLQMLLVGAALGLAGVLAVYGLTPAEAAKPSIIRDTCKGMSGGGGGLECPSSSHALVRFKDALGICTWKCCPPNGDGTYNCANATNPTRSILGGQVGPRPGTADPGPRRSPSTTAPKPGSASPN